ncbi:MAG: hypothetical protein ABII00_16195 [Elusimicrobiota bacterium]
MGDPPPLTLKTTAEFRAWYKSLGEVDQTKIDAWLDNMRVGVFRASKSLKRGLLELKWKNGMRVYYSRKRIAGANLIILWGGSKGTQSKDIRKARQIKRRYEDAFEEEG